MMFNKDKEGGGIQAPGIQIAGGTLRPAIIRAGDGSRAYGARWTKTLKAKGGVVKSGYRKAADGCAKRGKTRGKMV